ncbi:hypothetical protein LSH36_213g04008 [Paralvinella palmiformis]|uniref:Uncharacterized protein n=1 Tax=Paralvinella palmiformis TaxID=53620 RepID=A0AAD9JPB8_9ANNE|nr:hypothetical protein LSH36_213g04008 [Paralvinella palmiformis]
MESNVQSYGSDLMNSSQVVFHPLDHVDGPYVPALLNTTTSTIISTSTTEDRTESSHVLAYVLVPLGSLAVIALLSFIVIFILRKSR